MDPVKNVFYACLFEDYERALHSMVHVLNLVVLEIIKGFHYRCYEATAIGGHQGSSS